MKARIKYYEKVDQKLKLISLTFDKMFKVVFAGNKKALKKVSNITVKFRYETRRDVVIMNY